MSSSNGGDGQPAPRASEGAASGSGRGDGRSRGGRGRSRGGPQQRGGRGGQGRGRGGRGGDRQNPNVPADPAAQDVAAAAAAAKAQGVDGASAVNRLVSGNVQAGEDAESEADVCFICANPVAHHSIAPCNHTTCHICGLRMRALYKTKDCAHCRTPAPFVIFTDDAEKRFETYTDADITTTDSNIGIKYTNEDIVGDTVLLLRYNCPDPSCDFAGLGWPDLHRHVKTAHRKRMCDLCTRNKKVFTHEHELFADRELERHMRHGDDKPGAADQTGFKGHPLCGFCGERFYDDDKLYEHCRMKHERCFICDRRDSRKPHYYLDYNALEEHFKKDHYFCNDKECMEKKFVVFESELDLQAHRLSEHGGKAVGRDARVVDMSGFELRQAYHPERRDGEGQGRARGRGRGRGRDPNDDSPLPTSSAQPLRRDELAFQRQMAIHSAQSVSNRTFGGQLTPSAPPTPSGSQTPRGGASTPSAPINTTNLTENRTTDPSTMSQADRARLVRHGSVIERAANLLANDARKMADFRAHISAYQRGGLTAPQLIDALFTLFADTSSNALGTLVREVADLFEAKKKADDLRAAWQDWRAINEDYPSLPGLSGMEGATTSSSGWASAATANPAVPTGTAAPSQKHSTRVLKLKNSTRLGGPAPATQTGPPGWTARASTRAPVSAAFPSLPPSRTTASSSSSAAASPSWIGPSSHTPVRRATPAASGADAFPALPAAPKPTTTIFGYGTGRGVRRDYGQRESNFQWGGASGSGTATPTGEPEEAVEDKGKKGGKKSKKQVLVQWG